MEGENSIVEQIIKGMIDGVITMDTSKGKGNDQSKTMDCHAVCSNIGKRHDRHGLRGGHNTSQYGGQ